MKKTLLILEKVFNATKQFNKNTSMFVFRGQDAKYLLEPSLFRGDTNEVELLSKLSQEYKSYNYNTSSINTLTKLQHNRIPTRLLDWTTNPLVALFFACGSIKDHDQDGQLLLLPLKQEWQHFIFPVAQLICDIALYDISYYNPDSWRIAFKSNCNNSEITKQNIAYIFASRFFEITNTTSMPDITKTTLDRTLHDVDTYYPKEFMQKIKHAVRQIYGHAYNVNIEEKLHAFMRLVYAPDFIIHSPLVTPKVIAQASMLQVYAGKVVDGHIIMQSQPYTMPEQCVITIESSEKSIVLDELNKIFNINHKTLFVDEPNLSNEFHSNQ